MRITHVVRTDNFAGVERHVALLAAAQHDLGHTVTVLGGRHEHMGAAIDRPGVRLVPAVDRRTAARLLLGPAGRGADLVATHMTDADVVALTSPALVRTPIVSTRHFAARRGATPAHRSLVERLQPRLAAEIAVSAKGRGPLLLRVREGHRVYDIAVGDDVPVTPRMRVDFNPIASTVPSGTAARMLAAMTRNRSATSPPRSARASPPRPPSWPPWIGGASLA